MEKETKETAFKKAAIKELKLLQPYDDPEREHKMADDILCQLLTNLGYSEVVAEYDKVDKWYA